jgi:uncharacterized membrane protein YjfL (UPF0719 family)
MAGILTGIVFQYLVTVGWAIVGAVSMGIGISAAVKIFSWSTRGIDEEEELKKGNVAVAIVLASVIIGMAIVVAVTCMPTALPVGVQQ